MDDFTRITSGPVPGDIGTQTGFFNLLNPTPETVGSIEEIAYSLSRIVRWGGRGGWDWSVTDHSLLCDRLAQQHYGYNNDVRLAILMHDAPEWAVGDCQSPLKKLLMPLWGPIEAGVWAAIRARYGIGDHEVQIAHVDAMAAAIEKRELFPLHEHDWHLPTPIANFEIAYETPAASVWKFIKRAKFLLGESE